MVFRGAQGGSAPIFPGSRPSAHLCLYQSLWKEVNNNKPNFEGVALFKISKGHIVDAADNYNDSAHEENLDLSQ